MVNYELLMELAGESNAEYPIHEVISTLGMCDVPMTPAVIKLGIACGVLLDGYHNDWSLEEA